MASVNSRRPSLGPTCRVSLLSPLVGERTQTSTSTPWFKSLTGLAGQTHLSVFPLRHSMSKTAAK